MRPIRMERLFTERSQDSLQRYFNDLQDIDMISAEEEVSLALRIKAGDMQALDRLVKANLRFVVTVAKKYTNSNLPLADLINEGNIGLIRAAKSFDATKGFKFISYAVWWIRQSILVYIGDMKRLVRLPMNQIRNLQLTWTVSNQLEHVLGRKPTVEEISLETGFSKKLILEQLSFDEPVASFDAPLNDETGFSLSDVFSDRKDAADVGVLAEDFKGATLALLSMLDERERHVLCEFFGIGKEIPMSVDDLSEYHGVSRERIRYIYKSALKKLKRKAPQSILEYV